MNHNPLIAAYKKPAVYISLPSGGKYYDPKPKLSVDNELAIYPMTARDELIAKTPDALFNGEATVSLLESCCPDIPNPRQIPVNDLLVLMLAIRQATHGANLDVDVNCPNCKELNLMTIDSNRMLASIKPNQTDPELKLANDFKLEIKPYNLEDRTLLQIQQIKQQKMLTNLTNSTLTDDVRNRLFGETFVELAELTVDLIANCIVSVQAPGTDAVHDRTMILEWLKGISKADYEAIKDKIAALSESNMDTEVNAKCQACGTEWKTTIELDVANFFAG